MINDRNDLEFITDDIDTVSEESVDEVKEVNEEVQDFQEPKLLNKVVGQGMKTRAATVDQSKVIGQFNVLSTVGGSEITEKSAGSDEFTPQGTVEVTFTLSGDILSLAAKNSALSATSTGADLSSNKESLSTLIQKAYEETIKDANTGFMLKDDTDFKNRENLSFALQTIFGSGTGTPNDTLKLIFNSNNNDVKVITFKAEACFPKYEKCPNFIRNIIDLDAMNMATTGKAKATSSSDIPVKMIIRVEDPSTTAPLQTNTDYKFVGIENNENFKVSSHSDDYVTQPTSGREIILGFTMNNFKTKKASSHIITKVKETKGSTDIELVYRGKDGTTTSDKYKKEYLYLDTIKTSTTTTYVNMYTNYIDMRALTEKSNIDPSGDFNSSLTTADSAFKSPIERTGTSIKFKPLLFKDPDSTITKIEVEDSTGKLHKGKLSVDSSDPNIESGFAFLEITDLERSMPYTFTKLHITSNHGDKEYRKNFHFITYSASVGQWTASNELQVNTLPIRTTHFYGPKIVLVNNPSKTGSDLNLPDGLQVKSVKNDRTALRYILKPDNNEGTLGDITINGLRDEKYKIEKVLDKDGKISYWILTLYNLLPDYDYSFLILELSYTDPNGNNSITRQALSEINKTTNTKFDNRTEKTPLSLNEQFEIVVNDKIEAKDPRSVEVPVFVDDIHGKFVGIEMTPAKECPDAKAVYETGKIKVTDLTPDKTGVCRVDFLHNPDADNNSTYAFRNSNIQRIARYITITTPKVFDLDIKSATATVDMTTAEFKFEYYSDPKSPIKTVVVKDSAGKEMISSFDTKINVLKLEGLKEETTYSKVKVTFTLENSKTIDYTLEDFTTKKKEVVEEKPTGKVADFVAKVYTLALGREPEVEGWKFWIRKLESKELPVTQFIYDLMKQDEFVSRLMSREQFIKMMYEIIVGREPEEEGQKYWEQKYEEYRTQESTLADVRIRIVREMMDTAEFKSYVTSLGLKY